MDESPGLVMMGMGHAGLALYAYGDSTMLEYIECKDAEGSNKETTMSIRKIDCANHLFTNNNAEWWYVCF